MGDINIISWNVKGLNSPIKRTRVLEFLQRHRVSIAFLQETHLRQEDIRRFQNRRFKVIAHSCANTKSKGVLILADRSLQIHLDHIDDSSGRFVLVVGTFNNTRLLLSSIYAPNDFDPTFLSSIQNSLLLFPDTQLILGGDFNSVINPALDLSSGNIYGLAASNALNAFIKDLNLVDIWRIGNNLAREFSFYSARHQTYSRIDYIFVSSTLISNIPHVKMLPILLSDHSPILCNLLPSCPPAKLKRWRFNTSFLTNSDFLGKLKDHLVDFLEHNRNYTNPQLLWEACKCAIRGFCISFSSFQKKMRNKRFSELEQEVGDLERLQSEQFSEDRANSLSVLKSEYNAISLQKSEFILHRTKLKYYFHGDRPSRLLAWRLKQNEARASINAIKDKQGKIITSPVGVNKIFRSFYEDLYTSDITFNHQKCTDFLNRLSLPKLDPSESDFLERPVTLDELRRAAESLNKDKSPGSDGIPPELYIALWDNVGQLALDSINFAIKNNTFHRDQKTDRKSVV